MMKLGCGVLTEPTIQLRPNNRKCFLLLHFYTICTSLILFRLSCTFIICCPEVAFGRQSIFYQIQRNARTAVYLREL